MGEEIATLGNILGRVRGGDGTHFLRATSHGAILFEVSGTVPVGIRQQLASGDLELAESAAEMGVSVTGD